MQNLVPLVAGLVIFLGGHVVTRIGDTRARLVAHFGQNTYRGLYSLVALMGLALIAHGFAVYRAGGMIPLWQPPRWTAHLAMTLMAFSFVILASTWLPGRIKAAMKHPMLVAIKIWALAHLLANGDLGSVILFGSFLAWAVFTRIAIKRGGTGEIVPGADALAGNNRNDFVAVVVGLGAVLAFIYGVHRILIGVAVLS
ncbi:MAG: NnrU family protein [Proteobacteria bacterium]|nr:NnrU family protein [Pseudomonadota bacterium]